jgi:hypothetical protein
MSGIVPEGERVADTGRSASPGGAIGHCVIDRMISRRSLRSGFVGLSQSHLYETLAIALAFVPIRIEI